MHQYDLEQKETDLVKGFEKIDIMLDKRKCVVGFEQFLALEQIFDEKTNHLFEKYMQRYEQLANKYLLQIISNSKKSFKSLENTSNQYSYFFKQSMKLQNTPYFPFYDFLVELNFFYFLSKLYIDVRQHPLNQSKPSEEREINKYQYLIKTQNLCNDECIGCNNFYYQFYPIKQNTQKHGYKISFLSDNCIKRTLNALRPTNQLEHNMNTKIDIRNLQEKESQSILLREITKILNKKGGFIIIGCRRIQQFKSIKKQFTYEQICQNYMETQFVIGESLSEEQKGKMESQLLLIIKKIRPKVSFDKNISISFLPIRQSPYELGFEIQNIILDQQQFEEKRLHLIVIKINPTQKDYEVRLKQDLVQYEQCDQYPDFDEQSQKQQGRLKFLEMVEFGITENDQQFEHFSSRPQRSYFDWHQCNPLQYKQ